MGLFSALGDIAKLPLDIGLDVTGIRPMSRAFDDDDNHDTPFGTIDRLNQIVHDLDDDDEE
ncbi:MAG: hypothetical protein M0R17_00725 [Candidatus Omnitrophica bacterium]|jgi:hypothetical protein|nr:hypothetical protein [Candidatus Omnitrophota bacterium]